MNKDTVSYGVKSPYYEKKFEASIIKTSWEWAELGWKEGWFNKKEWTDYDEIAASLQSHLIKNWNK